MNSVSSSSPDNVYYDLVFTNFKSDKTEPIHVGPRPNRALYIYIYRSLFGRVLLDEVYRRLFF